MYIPDDVGDIKKQAEELHQCLIAQDYVKRVIDGKCVLVFIRRGDKPVATAEIVGGKFPGGRIGQFYADEYDRGNCLPDADVKQALDLWLRSARGLRGEVI